MKVWQTLAARNSGGSARWPPGHQRNAEEVPLQVTSGPGRLLRLGAPHERHHAAQEGPPVVLHRR